MTDYAQVFACSRDSNSGGVTSNGNWYFQAHRTDCIIGPFRVAHLEEPTDYTSWKPRDTMAWWQDGTSNQIIFGEKFLPIGKDLNGSEEGGDMTFLAVGGHRIGSYRPIVRQYENNAAGALLEKVNTLPKDNLPGTTTSGDTDKRIVFNNGPKGGFGAWHPGATNFLIGDGSVRPFPPTTARATLRRLAIVHDGENVVLPQ